MTDIREGDILPGTEDFPAGLVAVPVVQLLDIELRLKKLVRLGQMTVQDWKSIPKQEEELRHQVFALSEMALLWAGNWTQRIKALGNDKA